MDRERLRRRLRLPFRCLLGVCDELEISTMPFESAELSDNSWDSMLCVLSNELFRKAKCVAY
jgi:hypothetical protein